MKRSEFLKAVVGGALGLALVNGASEKKGSAQAKEIKMDCLGDSTTWGADGIGKGDGPATSWVSHMPNLLGIKDVANVGKKGSRFAVTSDRKDSFTERVGKVRADADLVVVFGGVNDFHHDVPLGSLHDGRKDTFFGAVEFVLTTLIDQNPAREIVFMTPAKANFKHPTKHYPNTINGRGIRHEDYANAMKEVCAYYGVPVIDLFNESGISPFIESQQKLYMPDGLHYNKAGYERLAKRIAAKLKSICGCLQ